MARGLSVRVEACNNLPENKEVSIRSRVIDLRINLSCCILIHILYWEGLCDHLSRGGARLDRPEKNSKPYMGPWLPLPVRSSYGAAPGFDLGQGLFRRQLPWTGGAHGASKWGRGEEAYPSEV